MFDNSSRYILPVECNEGCWRVRLRPSVVSSIWKTGQSYRRMSYTLGLSTVYDYCCCCCCKEGMISGGALKYGRYHSSSCTVVVVQRSATSNMYVQSFVFAGRTESRLLESFNSAECCEFDKKNRLITLKGIIQGGRTRSECLLKQQKSEFWRHIEIRVLNYFYSNSSCIQ